MNVVYIIYNRPRHVLKTFEAIRAAKPNQLFIIADGPKSDVTTDAENCRRSRELAENVDWPCTVYKNYANENLGLKRRVSSGLDWVFSNVSSAIILEDDCLPNSDFFSFCDSLLKQYESEESVWTITGDNFQDGRVRGKASYYFSKYPHCWGWATWERAWKHFRGDIPFWPQWSVSEDWKKCHTSPKEEQYWSGIFQNVYEGKINSWAYPWTACVWYNQGLTATPNVNLVTNIGFGSDGTHCLQDDGKMEMRTQFIGQITHPTEITPDTLADRFVLKRHFLKEKATIMERVHDFIYCIILQICQILIRK